jgi:MinD-like ATPase involved in chromosome partitioning or flagellar assembly
VPAFAYTSKRMSRIISVHSFRGGTGKSNTTANVATLLAAEGRRVGVIDTDIQSPGIHVLFGLSDEAVRYALNDYLWGRCEIAQAAYDVTPNLGPALGGRVFLIPSSIKTGEIARVLREGYDVGLLNDGYRQVIDDLALDALVIDTHPGLNEETLLSIAISDALAIILRPDHQDYQGTGVTVEVARKLDVPRLLLVVNKVPASFDADVVRARVEAAYGCPVAAVLPHSDELMTLASSGVFALRYPDHPLTARYRAIAAQLWAEDG